jgi:hypothetical protein
MIRVMVGSVAEAVLSHWNAHPELLNYAPNGLWFGEGPETNAPPSATFSIGPETPEWTFANAYTESTPVMLTLYSHTLGDLESGIEAVKAAFDEAALPVHVGALQRFARQSVTRSLIVNVRDTQAERIFQGDVDYLATVTRSLTPTEDY